MLDNGEMLNYNAKVINMLQIEQKIITLIDKKTILRAICWKLKNEK